MRVPTGSFLFKMLGLFLVIPPSDAVDQPGYGSIVWTNGGITEVVVLLVWHELCLLALAQLINNHNFFGISNT